MSSILTIQICLVWGDEFYSDYTNMSGLGGWVLYGLYKYVWFGGMSSIPTIQICLVWGEEFYTDYANMFGLEGRILYWLYKYVWFGRMGPYCFTYLVWRDDFYNTDFTGLGGMTSKILSLQVCFVE